MIDVELTIVITACGFGPEVTGGGVGVGFVVEPPVFPVLPPVFPVDVPLDDVIDVGLPSRLSTTTLSPSVPFTICSELNSPVRYCLVLPFSDGQTRLPSLLTQTWMSLYC